MRMIIDIKMKIINDDLPPGWFTAVDQDSGDTYYCNEATGETTLGINQLCQRPQ